MITHRAPEEKRTQISSLGRVERRCRALQGVVFHRHFTGWEKTFSSSSYFSLDVRNKWCIRLRDLWPNRVDGACLDGGVLSLLVDSRFVEWSKISNCTFNFVRILQGISGFCGNLVPQNNRNTINLLYVVIYIRLRLYFKFNIKYKFYRL